jgi:proteasome lid subunit RPN8/RPN11
MILSPHHRAVIIAHAHAQAPQEACGLLAGAGGRVRRTYRLPNVSDTPLTNFLADPEQQLRAFQDTERRGLEILAIFHSHPASPAYPSETDIARAYYPQARHVIWPEAIRKSDASQSKPVRSPRSPSLRARASYL